MKPDPLEMQNPFIVGERLYLRPLEPAQDNHLYSTWMNDEEIRRYFSIYPTSDYRGKERLEQLYKDGKHIIFGIALKENNRLIGLVGLKDIDYINQTAEFYNIVGDKSVGGMLILVTQVPLPVKVPGVHFKWLYCCRGPSVERLDSPALAALIEHAHRIASKEHAVLLRLEPNIADDDPDMDAWLAAYRGL